MKEIEPQKRHKQNDDGPKYCWVRQWQGSGNGTFKESKKGQFIDPRDFLIGQQMRNLHQIS